MTYEATGKAKAMIDHMARHHNKDWFTAVELADVGQTQPSSITGFLKSAIDHGLCFTVHDGKRRLYGLRPGQDTAEPAHAEPAALKGFNAALWSDGDLVVHGYQLNEDDSITFNRQQAAQIRRLLCGTVV
jgi:hypothetical protein